MIQSNNQPPPVIGTPRVTVDSTALGRILECSPETDTCHFDSMNSPKLMHCQVPIQLIVAVLLVIWPVALTIGCTTPVARTELAPAPARAASPSKPSEITLNSPILHQNLPIAAKLLRSGQFVDAQIVLRSILRDRPDCARAEFLLGIAVMKEKHYGEARPWLESALARNQDFPERIQVDHFLGWTCYYLGDLESSKRHFQSHVGAVPTADDSYFGLGVVAIDEDRIADAEVALQRALELIGTNSQRLRDRSKALARLGDLELRREHADEALAFYEESALLWPEHYEVWGKLARMYESLNRPSDADQARTKQQAVMQRSGRASPAETAP